MSKEKEADLKVARDFLKFNDRSKSPYHAVASIASMLTPLGFEALDERDDWNGLIRPGGKYMFTRDGSAILAFAVGESSGDIDTSFCIVGAHTDSPCFKVKPLSKIRAHGFIQVGVECYGGGLWHTWFDRDLTVAGRVVMKRKDGEREMRLVSVRKPILRIPNLAIHLNRSSEGFKPNKETETTPIMATELAAALNNCHASTQPHDSSSAAARHSTLLLQALAEELDCSIGDIIDLELYVADTQDGAIGGVLDEFIFAPRLDNLASCYVGTKSLMASVDKEFMKDSGIRMIACFDHEEVGSSSMKGADSPLLTDTMRRICDALGANYDQALASSLLVSADMAHGIHPNYASKHEGRHRPSFGKGLVIKTNQNQRYATSGLTGYMMREAGRNANVETQEFVVANDRPCGSTIGPILASRSGLRTIDVGQAQLSMHSIREMCGVRDLRLMEIILGEMMENYQKYLNSVRARELGQGE